MMAEECLPVLYYPAIRPNHHTIPWYSGSNSNIQYLTLILKCVELDGFQHLPDPRDRYCNLKIEIKPLQDLKVHIRKV